MDSEITLGWVAAWQIVWSLCRVQGAGFPSALWPLSRQFPSLCPPPASGCTDLQCLEQQDRDVGRGFLAAEGCQQKIITNWSHRVWMNTKLLHQRQPVPWAGSEPWLAAALSLGQVLPWAWGTNSAGLRGMSVNKTREDRKLWFFVLCFFHAGYGGLASVRQTD